MGPRLQRREPSILSNRRWQVVLAIAGFVALAACANSNTSPAGDRAAPTGTFGSGGTASGRGTTPSTTKATSSAGCKASKPVPTGTTDRTVTSGGEPRSYQLIVPANYDGSKAMPIVFSLHPDVISYKIIPPMVGFPDMVAKHDFIGVSPSGLLNGTIPYWMAVRTEPPSRDITFFSDLLDQLETELCVDPGRVYATGMANGAQMASLLACQLGDRITAVAPLAGPEWVKECNGRPVPVMAFHGDKDPFVSYQDSRGDAKDVADKNYWKGNAPPGLPVHEGAEKAMANWAAHNGCDPNPLVENISKDVVRTTWQHCKADTVFFHIVGGGHTWPSRPVPAFEKTFGYTTMDIDATELMFEFFFDHTGEGAPPPPNP